MLFEEDIHKLATFFVKNRLYILIIIGYVVAVVSLLSYSYTQVDLNLTLSRVSIIQTVQKSFQYIGFYQRPFSTVLYISIITLFFGLYIAVQHLVQQKLLDRASIWKIVFIVVAILIFSYPAAFSYDFFNYMFTAKTVLVYHKSPYIITPLMFAGVDPWINFMRWTHLSSAYAPLWIILTLVPYLLGFGYFVLIMINMKVLIALFYLLSCFMIEKILLAERPSEATLGLSLFALNPLIIVETLVSSHNDIVLSAFLLVSLWYVGHKDMVTAWFWLSMSIASKLMTLTLVPLYALKTNRRWMLVAMLAGLVVVVIKREFLPWYLVWIMPFIALQPRRKDIFIASTVLSFGLLLSYCPYLYIGSFTSVGQVVKLSIITASVIGAVVSLLASSIQRSYVGRCLVK